jgi:histidinol dehydrogenase
MSFLPIRRKRSKVDKVADVAKAVAQVWTSLKLGSAAAKAAQTSGRAVKKGAKTGAKAYGSVKVGGFFGKRIVRLAAIPAAAAGVRDIVVACPRPDAVVMAAALEAGVTRLFRVGGAHAVAALAYGTATVPRVDKIVGPGNRYVATAKACVARDCAIDFYAGPSEIAVLSVGAPPAWVAADLIAQAEHDPDARPILLTPSRRLAAAVSREVVRRMPRGGPAPASIARNGGIVLTRTLDEAIELCQRLAPEHLVCDSDAVAKRLTRAGTVFVGRYSAQASGDYVTGSNHVLPTNGAARARGGLSAADFVRVATVQHLTAAGLRSLAPAGIALATAEHLEAHAASIRIRFERGSRRDA